MRILITSAAMLIGICSRAQDSVTSPKPFAMSGYLEAYYSYDFNNPSSNNRPGFIYNFNRHNEFNVNLGLIKAAYVSERVRGNLAIAVGTYVNANYSAEPATLKNIFEANVGAKLTPKASLWFDIGILPSHIGFESAIGKDNWTLTRSLVAESTPYFESGARLSFSSGDGKLQLSALALNGWQRITRLEGNSLMSWGTQISYRPSEKITFNYSTFIGTDKPDSARLWRYHHNIYAVLQVSDLIGLVGNFDLGFEETVHGNNEMNIWYSPVCILRITPGGRWAFAVRGEYFSDEKGVIVSTATPGGFKTFGSSMNIDYSAANSVLVRIEGRYFNSREPIFSKSGLTTDNNAAFTFSTAIAF